jgi:predicted NBD/HSP70 family sugar kinase
VYVIFDVGGTNTRIACSEDGRSFTQAAKLVTDPGPQGFDAFVAALKQTAAGRPVWAVAGGLPGHANLTGTLQQAPNLPGWHGIPVVERLQHELGVPVVIDNDTAVVGLGEAVFGAGREHDIVVYMTVSTGVNGVRLIKDDIDVSTTGFELGSMLLSDDDGQLVSLESLAGGAALERRYGRHPRDLREPTIWRTEARYLARALYNTLLHWSPEVVVYGGGMMRDISLDVIAEELAAFPPVFELQPELKLAELGDEGGLYGALALLKDHHS